MGGKIFLVAGKSCLKSIYFLFSVFALSIAAGAGLYLGAVCCGAAIKIILGE